MFKSSVQEAWDGERRGTMVFASKPEPADGRWQVVGAAWATPAARGQQSTMHV